MIAMADLIVAHRATVEHAAPPGDWIAFLAVLLALLVAGISLVVYVVRHLEDPGDDEVTEAGEGVADVRSRPTRALRPSPTGGPSSSVSSRRICEVVAPRRGDR
jgi:hypothetical protein